MDTEKIDRHSDRDALLRLHRKPGLVFPVRHLASIEALIALGEERVLHHVFEMALDDGVSLDDIHEVMLQACIFCGFPRTINAFMILNRCLGERGQDVSTNASIPLDDRAPRDTEIMGRGLFRTIYRTNHEEVLQALKESHAELPGWILGVVYGMVLSRPALDAKTRELAAVAALTVSKVYPQLLSHIKGGLNLGADFAEVREIILQMEAFVPQEVINRALRILNLGTRAMGKPPHPSVTEVS